MFGCQCHSDVRVFYTLFLISLLLTIIFCEHVLGKTNQLVRRFLIAD